MQNDSHSPVTEMLSPKYKLWLLSGIVVMLAGDLCVCLYLWVTGAPDDYWAIPLALAVFDALYIAGIVFSNQRFKYARSLMIAFVIFSAGFLLLSVLTTLAASGTVFLPAAVWLSPAFHAVGYIAAVIAYFYASRRFKRNKAVQTAVVATAVICFAATFTAYGVSLLTKGYFWQGAGVRPIVYEINEDGDGYKAADVLAGSGSEIIVPREFNGKKVDTVSAKIFCAPGVKSVRLECDGDIAFADIQYFSKTGKVSVYADKKAVDDIKRTLYSIGHYSYEACFKVANGIIPTGLSDGEVCITFAYDSEAYDTAETAIPTWYGKKGDVFESELFYDRINDENCEYMLHTNSKSDSDLQWCFGNNGYIMRPLFSDGSLDGKTVDSSIYGINVSFDRIFKIRPGESNDTRFKTEDHFEYSQNGNVRLDYRLTTAENADGIARPFEREGFSLLWRLGNVSTSPLFTSLSQKLSEFNGDSSHDQIVYPYWTLDAPFVRLTTGSTAKIEWPDDPTEYEDTFKQMYESWLADRSSEKGSVPALNGNAEMDIGTDGHAAEIAEVTYGDPYYFTATASHVLNGTTFKYAWIKDDTTVLKDISSLNVFGYTRMPYDGGGKYSVAVQVSAPEITSLVSSGIVSVKVSVKNRIAEVIWDSETETTYDGNRHNVTVSLGNILDGDEVGVNQNSFSYVNAGTYNTNVYLTGADRYGYDIAPGNSSHKLKILPCVVDIDWGIKTSFVYNGSVQNPTADAEGVNGSRLQVILEGTGANAGTYTALAHINDNNYKVNSATAAKEYTIVPLGVSASWGSAELTYNGGPQVPVATAIGINNSRIPVSVSGAQTDCGDNYTAIAESSDGNYVITDNAKTVYSIKPYGVVIVWKNTSFVYDGYDHSPTASATGVGGVGINVIVSGNGTDAGTYTALAFLSDKNYTAAENGTVGFVIEQRGVSVVWSNDKPVYNGRSQAPTAVARGVFGNNIEVTVTGGGVNAGGYTAKASISDKNYKITSGGEHRFTIAKKSLTVKVSSLTVGYGETPEIKISVTGIEGGDTVMFTPVIDGMADGSGNIPVGTYTVGAECEDAEVLRNYAVTVEKGTLTVVESGDRKL